MRYRPEVADERGVYGEDGRARAAGTWYAAQSKIYLKTERWSEEMMRCVSVLDLRCAALCSTHTANLGIMAQTTLQNKGQHEKASRSRESSRHPALCPSRSHRREPTPLTP
jgi:hypothetical protein